jgi:hypothetical protein
MKACELIDRTRRQEALLRRVAGEVRGRNCGILVMKYRDGIKSAVVSQFVPKNTILVCDIERIAHFD